VISLHLIDVLVSLVTILAACSVAASIVMEWISSRLQRRAWFLRTGLQRLVQDRVLYLRVMNHPTILASSGRKERGGAASYLSGADFATALVDSIIRRVAIMNSVSGVAPVNRSLFESIEQLEKWGSMTGRALRPSLSPDMPDHEAYGRIAAWYDKTMDRISGNYKRGTQAWLFWMGLTFAAALNVDTLKLAGDLWDASLTARLRSTTPHSSSNLSALPRPSANTDKVKVEPTAEKVPYSEAALARLSKAGAPLAAEVDREIPIQVESASPRGKPFVGYACMADARPLASCLRALERTSGRQIFSTFFGWLVTAVAISFGASFWFDLLNKLVNVRSSGVRPARSAKD
jgi:hypothetical protein